MDVLKPKKEKKDGGNKIIIWLILVWRLCEVICCVYCNNYPHCNLQKKENIFIFVLFLFINISCHSNEFAFELLSLQEDTLQSILFLFLLRLLPLPSVFLIFFNHITNNILHNIISIYLNTLYTNSFAYFFFFSFPFFYFQIISYPFEFALCCFLFID